MNPLPKMPPIPKKKAQKQDVALLTQPKPDVVQVADDQQQPPPVDPAKDQDGIAKEGNENNDGVSHDDEGIADDREEPDEDFEFGDQTEAELAAISQ